MLDLTEQEMQFLMTVLLKVDPTDLLKETTSIKQKIAGAFQPPPPDKPDGD